MSSRSTKPNDDGKDNASKQSSSTDDMDDTVVGAPSAEDMQFLHGVGPGAFVKIPTVKNVDDSSVLEQSNAIVVDIVDDEHNLTRVENATSTLNSSSIQTMDWANTGAVPN